MSEQKRYYWIKLKTDFFNQETIDFLLSQENGCQYIVLYQMLCLNTANNNGEMATRIGEMIIPYDINKIVRDTKYFTFDTVAVALELFKKLGLIYQEEGEVLKISNFEDMVGSETKSAQIKRKQRQNNIPLNNCKRLNAEMLRLPSGNTVYVDEKRYGGNGMLAYDLAGGKCEKCGSEENLCIHHNNGYSNNVEDLYILCRKCHSYVENNEGVEIVHRYVHQEKRVKSLDIRDKSLEGKKESTAAAPPTPAQRPSPEMHRHGEYGWVRLTDDQYAKLVKDLGQAELDRCIAYIDESAQGNGNKNRWKDWNLVIRKCSREGWGRNHGGYAQRGNGFDTSNPFLEMLNERRGNR